MTAKLKLLKRRREKAAAESDRPATQALPGGADPAAEDVIVVRQLHKSFGTHEVLRGVDLTVKRGEVICVLGRSGSGKTTLVRCLNLLEVPSSGEIDFLGAPVFGGRRKVPDSQLVLLRRKLGMLFQSFNVFPHMSVIENVALPLVHNASTPEREAVSIALDVLARVGLRDRALAMPSQLSGGQLQRVALARALALRPAALLFDEPTSALDPESTADVLEVMKQLRADGMTMVIVTHEVPFALSVADQIVMMDDGVIVETGRPREISANPQHPRTRAYFYEHIRSGMAPILTEDKVE